MVRTVKALPTILKSRSSGAIPRAWQGTPSRSIASLSVLVEWRLNSSRCASESISLASWGWRPGPGRPPAGGAPGRGLLLRLAGADRRQLVGRDGGQDLLGLAVDL